MDQEASKSITVAIVIIFAGALAYFTVNQKTSSATPVLSPIPAQPPGHKPAAQDLPSKPTSLDVNDYQSIILHIGKPNYVKAGGSIKILFSKLSTISFVIEKVNSPNVEFNSSALPFAVYINESTFPKDQSKKFVNGNYGDYYYIFTAPKIPGKYDLVFSKPELDAFKITDVAERYSITVIDQVNSKLLTTKIVDLAIFASLNEGNIKNWKIVSQQIKSVGNSWDVLMQVTYDSCGNDWESNVCVPKIVEGHYLIDKRSGMVTGRNVWH